MTTFIITVQDKGVQAVLQALVARVSSMGPALTALGDDITDRTKHRFDTSIGPDGEAWKPYPVGGATLTMLAQRIGGSKSKVKKDGSLNARGARELAGKKLLIGESKELRRQIFPSVAGNTLTVTASNAYAAMQQFGGTTSSRSMIPGKVIQARPFLPVRLDGTLYPQEQALVLQALNDFLVEGL